MYDKTLTEFVKIVWEIMKLLLNQWYFNLFIHDFHPHKRTFWKIMYFHVYIDFLKINFCIYFFLHNVQEWLYQKWINEIQLFWFFFKNCFFFVTQKSIQMSSEESLKTTELFDVFFGLFFHVFIDYSLMYSLVCSLMFLLIVPWCFL